MILHCEMSLRKDQRDQVVEGGGEGQLGRSEGRFRKHNLSCFTLCLLLNGFACVICKPALNGISIHVYFCLLFYVPAGLRVIVLY